MKHLSVDGQRLEYCDFPGHADRPVLLMLHEGLGSVSMWRDFPQQVAAATACRTIVWSRAGYGSSTPYAGARTPQYMHHEAQVALPGFIRALAIERYVLFGHSDGGSIALIHAGTFPDAVAGVAVMAPHEFVEEVTLAGIREARRIWDNSDWRLKLARHHADPARVFHDWNDNWLAPEFRDWNIEAYLARIRCPVLAIQGEGDEYATMRQIEVIAEHVADSELLKLADCGHSPHRDQPAAVLAALSRFMARF